MQELKLVTTMAPGLAQQKPLEAPSGGNFTIPEREGLEKPVEAAPAVQGPAVVAVLPVEGTVAYAALPLCQQADVDQARHADAIAAAAAAPVVIDNPTEADIQEAMAAAIASSAPAIIVPPLPPAPAILPPVVPATPAILPATPAGWPTHVPLAPTEPLSPAIQMPDGSSVRIADPAPRFPEPTPPVDQVAPPAGGLQPPAGQTWFEATMPKPVGEIVEAPAEPEIEVTIVLKGSLSEVMAQLAKLQGPNPFTVHWVAQAPAQ